MTIPDTAKVDDMTPAPAAAALPRTSAYLDVADGSQAERRRRSRSVRDAERMTAAEVLAMLKRLPNVERMDAAAILRELPDLAPLLAVWEDVLDELRERRLDDWCAARLRAKPPEGDRPIFMTLAGASSVSEALVLKNTKKAFLEQGIPVPR